MPAKRTPSLARPRKSPSARVPSEKRSSLPWTLCRRVGSGVSCAPLQEEGLRAVEVDDPEGAGPMLDLHHEEGGVGDLADPADGQRSEHRLHDVLERAPPHGSS